MDFLQLSMKVALQNAEKLWYVGAILVSIVIALVGVLKKYGINHIQNKGVRKTLLATSNIVFSFISTAVYFVIDNINWRWYWVGGIITTFACIATYFVYENYHIREAVHKVGGYALGKISYLAKLVWDKLFNKTDKKIKVETKKVYHELKNYAQNEFKLATNKIAKADKELENL